MLHLLKGVNTDSGSESVPARFKGIEALRTETELLHPVLSECRVVKSEKEARVTARLASSSSLRPRAARLPLPITTPSALRHAASNPLKTSPHPATNTPAQIAVMRYAAGISSRAHVETMRSARAGMAEYQARDDFHSSLLSPCSRLGDFFSSHLTHARPPAPLLQLESTFLHWCYFNGGCRHVSYTCICATGLNAATLHYGHAGAPNDRVFSEGDMALLDMGAEYMFYGSDITRSFPVGGRFSADQRVVYGAVLAAQDAVMAAMRPGVEWADMHRLAVQTILAGLAAGGVLRGEVGEMEKMHLGAVFMPHGLGHLLARPPRTPLTDPARTPARLPAFAAQSGGAAECCPRFCAGGCVGAQGIDTHDVGGYNLKGRGRIDEPGIRSLRMNRPLQQGMARRPRPRPAPPVPPDSRRRSPPPHLVSFQPTPLPACPSVRPSLTLPGHP